MTIPAETARDADVIEVVSAVLATHGCFPIRVCSTEPHDHLNRQGLATPCLSRGKRPLDGQWSQGNAKDGMAALLSWLDAGHNVGIVPTGRVIGIDEDVVGGLDRFFARVGETIPVTLGDVVPATGKRHIFVKLPEDFDATALPGVFGDGNGTKFGELARAGSRQFVAPGCEWVSADGRTRSVRQWNGESNLATLSVAATQALMNAGEANPIRLARDEQGVEWQWTESMGSRHDLMVREARRLAGTIRDVEDLTSILWKWGQSHGLTGLHPETGRNTDLDEVREAARSAIAKFAPDGPPITLLVPRIAPASAPASAPAHVSADLFVKQGDYHAQNASTPTYVSPLVAYGTVSLISGPPKGGKSTLISNLLAARQNGTTFLWGDPVPQGPMALITEEGGYPVVRKTQGLPDLDILDRMAFAVAGLHSLAHLLAALDAWVATQDSPALVVIDTLAVWGDIKDENDAMAATTAITALRVWAQRTGSAVVLVHHTRKGGGEHGEAIRGSGGIFAAVDQSVELGFTNEKQSDDRSLDVTGRLTFGESKTLAFDRTSMTYSITTRVPVEKYPTTGFPVDGSGQSGWTNIEAGQAWGMTPGAANKHLKDLAGEGVLVARLEQTPGSRGKHLAYHKARPLLVLDNRSKGEQMADIFSGKEGE